MDASSLLRDTAARLFGDLPAGSWSPETWAAVERAGLHLALMPESGGGFGVTVPEAFGLLREAGAAALGLPLAETMIALKLLAEAGLEAPPGPLSIGPVVGPAPRVERDGGGWRLRAEVGRIPWGRNVAGLALLAGGPDGTMLVCVPARAWRVAPGENIAGEPRDTLAIEADLGADCAAPTEAGPDTVRVLGAAARCQMIAGAIARVCDMAVQYAQERVQFGRPIGRFQAVQQNLAMLAGQGAAATAAADLAADAVNPVLRPLAVAAAKVRAGEAAGTAASIAHQVHGAMGFTREHRLHLLTRRLWSWRDEFGNEAFWSRMLGRHLAAAGAGRLWAEICELEQAG